MMLGNLSTWLATRAPFSALLPQESSSKSATDVLFELVDRPVVRAALIIAAAIVLARAIDWLARSALRALAARTETHLDDEVIDSLHGPIVKSVVLAGLWMACDELSASAGSLLWAQQTIVTLGVLVWVLASLRVSGRVLRALAGDRSKLRVVEDRTLPLFDNLAKVALVAIAGYLLIEIWDLDATGWIASAGVLGIALGFAAKDTLANLFAGVFIIADAPYHVGDYIVLDTGHRGRVQHIGLRSTRILTRDDVQITIPNSIIGNGAIVNETSGSPQFRMRVEVGVAYGSDLPRVREVLLEVAEQEPMLMRAPEPRVRFRSFGASALDFELLVWIAKPEDRGLILDKLNMAVHEAFARAGIEIAFPQRDLHLRSMPADWSQSASGEQG